MTRKADFFDRIENYCLEQLSEKEMLDFEAEMLHNEELREETNLQKEIQSAITEKDVLNLRVKLSKIINRNKSDVTNTTFEILNELNNLNLSENTPEEIDVNEFRDSMPRIHVYQHNKTNGENIHPYYLEQNKSGLNGEESGVNGFDGNEFEEFEGIEDALLEIDVMQLRDQLKQVSESVQPLYPTEKIEDYIQGNLTDTEKELFELEIAQNKELKEEVALHKELKEAINEAEILDLRHKISEIIQRETSWSATDRQIEEYIEGTLRGEDLIRFEKELAENSDLRKEVILRKQIIESLKEKDIVALREKLENIQEDSKTRNLKSIVPDTKTRMIGFLRNSVAVLVFLVGVITIVSYWQNTPENIYENNYELPVVGPERSTEKNFQVMMEGNLLYSQGKYADAISKYLQVLGKNSDDYVAQFYLGASYQNTNKYNSAIHQYSKVITHGDNEYVEEAEWFRALCYLKLGEKKNARKELLAIQNRNGDYSKEARSVIRKLKYLRK